MTSVVYLQYQGDYAAAATPADVDSNPTLKGRVIGVIDTIKRIKERRNRPTFAGMQGRVAEGDTHYIVTLS